MTYWQERIELEGTLLNFTTPSKESSVICAVPVPKRPDIRWPVGWASWVRGLERSGNPDSTVLRYEVRVAVKPRVSAGTIISTRPDIDFMFLTSGRSSANFYFHFKAAFRVSSRFRASTASGLCG